ncbi:HAD-like protein [Coccomyxa subellipsoidea C-169]|uniref:Mitochondrial import inner membrane translocase subunit TIM50 n=1 Tax=Coccomyxa subellipsoidea (strain C-169) TaxID=574566 RepID=I0YQ70_COCSC|nr:HAD-like protein [Coccomyxa subellipsoidea C-169]EIE20539.1 HAD-like protein [Coccomyxa subellipsoidea C-169]|eukprot:XP_005645083.1 HAD-like protein [Coccomyxa subellipsoidea C-169]
MEAIPPPDVNSKKETQIPNPQLLLGPQQKRDRGRKTLILDLDNTLIVNATETRGDHDFTIIASFKDSDIIKYMHIRPWVDALLSAASQHFEIGVFTAATAEYAWAVLEVIDPNKVVSCIMVDDRPEVVMPRENVLPIVKYLEKDPDDEELLDILPLLLSLNKDSDVRHRLRAINESEEDEGSQKEWIADFEKQPQPINESEEVEGSQKEWIADFEKQPQPLPQPAGNVENWIGCVSVAAMLELYGSRLHAPLANLIDLTENLIDLTSEVD